MIKNAEYRVFYYSSLDDLPSVKILAGNKMIKKTGVIRSTRPFTYSLLILSGGQAAAVTISGLVINKIIEHYGLIGAEQGYMNSMIGIGNTVAVFSTIALYWKMKKTSILALSGLIVAAAMMLTGFSTSFIMLLVVSLVLGLGVGWVDTYSNSCIVDANPVNSAKYQGALHGFWGIGAMITPFVVSLLLINHIWQEVYMILATVILLTIIIYMIMLRFTNKRIKISGIESPKISGTEIISFFKMEKNVLLLLACLTCNMMQYSLFAWLVRYMNVQHGSEAFGMTSITVMWLFTTISRFIIPRLPIDSMKLHTYGAFLAGMTLCIGVLSNNPLMMCVMVGVGALTSGHCTPTLINKSVITYEGNSILPTSAMLLIPRVGSMAVPAVLGWISVSSMQASMLIPIITIIISGACGLAFLRYKN